MLFSLTGGCASLPPQFNLAEYLSPTTPQPPAQTVPETQPAPTPIVETRPAAPHETIIDTPVVAQPLPEAPPRETGHIALLLPLKSTAFAAAAEAVRDGFKAAAREPGATANLPIRHYPTTDQVEDIVAAYRNALQQGARLVVGPLTRNAVAALAASDFISVPTLALNTPESEQASPENLYLFSLSVEAESRQVARLAFIYGARKAVSIAAVTPLAKRAQQAFLDEWQKLGGEVIGQVPLPQWKEGYGVLTAAIAPLSADMYFLAADAEKSLLARPYLNQGIPVYATSQSFSGKSQQYKSGGLNDVRFVDMPWLVQPDHPAVMVYPHATLATPDLERLYAFGIDAFRLGKALLNSPLPNEFMLDGVTGKITLKEGSTSFLRESIPAQFQQGKLLLDPAPR